MIEISCNQVAWDDARHIELVRACETYEGVDYLREHIQRNAVMLFEVSYGETLVGVFLARIETMLNGKEELVVINGKCFSEKNAGFTMLVTAHAKLIAAKLSIPSCRIHSSSRGVDKLLARSGWKQIETVHRIEV